MCGGGVFASGRDWGGRTVGGGLDEVGGLCWEGHSGWSLCARVCFQGVARKGAMPNLLYESATGIDACGVLEYHKHAATDILNDSNLIHLIIQLVAP